MHAWVAKWVGEFPAVLPSPSASPSALTRSLGLVILVFYCKRTLSLLYVFTHACNLVTTHLWLLVLLDSPWLRWIVSTNVTINFWIYMSIRGLEGYYKILLPYKVKFNLVTWNGYCQEADRSSLAVNNHKKQNILGVWSTILHNSDYSIIVANRVKSGLDDPDNLGHFFSGSSGSHLQT